MKQETETLRTGSNVVRNVTRGGVSRVLPLRHATRKGDCNKSSKAGEKSGALHG
jgi:hypothetical protein